MCLLVNNPFTSCLARPRPSSSLSWVECVGFGCFGSKVLTSAGTRLLVREQGVVDLVGNADTAGLGKRFGVLLAQERAPHAHGRPAAEWSVALDAGEDLAEHG